MIKYEYEREEIELNYPDALINVMKEMGAEGWRVCHIQKSEYMSHRVEVYFEREKAEE